MRAIAFLSVLLVVAVLGLALIARIRPEDRPWMPLDLAAPIGTATGAKLAALDADPARCRSLLVAAGVRDRPAPPVSGPGLCGYCDGMRLAAGGASAIDWSPAPTTRCAVAASLAVWEWQVVQPAAIRRFGVPVVGIAQLGSYACRRIAGTGSRGWSEHATANAIDVSGFRLADGRYVTVVADWRGRGRAATFLHDVRDGACQLFATVLSPDYNVAHRNHLHFDQAERGRMGWRACR